MDKLDQRANISLTLAERFYTCNIGSLLLLAIIIISLIHKLNYSLNGAGIELVNIYNVSCHLLPVS